MYVDTTKLAKPNETIQEHTDHILQVGTTLLDVYASVVDNLAQKLPEVFFTKTTSEDRKEEITSFILGILRFHDYGKINPAFQEHIKREKSHDKTQRKHAIYSFYLWLIRTMETSLSESAFLIRSMIGFACITGHHGSLKELSKEVKEKEFRVISETIDEMKSWDCVDLEEINDLKDALEDFKYENLYIDSDIAMFFCKFVFSILTVSDSISSSEIPPEDYEKIVFHLFQKNVKQTPLHEQIRSSFVFKGDEHTRLDKDKSFKELTNMNQVRTLLNQKSIGAYDKEVDIYILEAPVGTGKTLSSLSLVDEIMEQEDKKKVITVFPLNSVQTQYVETMTETIELEEKFINVINSDSLFGLDNESSELDFSINSSNLWLFERNCFANEFIITSHVRFFQTITSMKRKESLGFLNLANSVIILDEFQNYPPKYWFSIWNELLLLSEMFGVKWVFTTGTFPVSESQLSDTFGRKIKKVLNEQEHEDIFTSPYVKDRCAIQLLSKNMYETPDLVAKDIIEDIRKQETIGQNQFVICASFVKQTKELYHLISEELKDYRCYFLCGRHNSRYKKELMKTIHMHNQNKTDKIILITTKTVECGMDFDFDYGYKEFDMFDSVEQLSGRVNRSNKKMNGGVKAFRLQRMKLEHEKLYTYDDLVLEGLQNKSFISLYECMYFDNKVSLPNYIRKMEELNKQFAFVGYSKEMTIIEEQDYATDILLVTETNEEDLMGLIESPPENSSYADHVIHSMKLRQKLELYQVTVTNKWLLNRVGIDLIERECNGMFYFLAADESNMDRFMETYVINGIHSYLEKEPSDDATFEFY